MDERQLQLQIVGHRLAVGLVFRIDLAAKGRLGAVEGADQIVGRQAAQEQQIAREAEQGVGRHAGRTRHAADGMEDLEDERVRIDQVESSGYSARRHDGRRPMYKGRRQHDDGDRSELQCGHGIAAVENLFRGNTCSRWSVLQCGHGTSAVENMG